jgi:hypothetical protein
MLDLAPARRGNADHGPNPGAGPTEFPVLVAVVTIPSPFRLVVAFGLDVTLLSTCRPADWDPARSEVESLVVLCGGVSPVWPIRPSVTWTPTLW